MQSYVIKIQGEDIQFSQDKKEAIQDTKDLIAEGHDVKLFLRSVMDVEVPLKPDVPPVMPKE